MGRPEGTRVNYNKSHGLQPTSIVAHTDSNHAQLDVLQPLRYHAGLGKSLEVWVVMEIAPLAITVKSNRPHHFRSFP